MRLVGPYSLKGMSSATCHKVDLLQQPLSFLVVAENVGDSRGGGQCVDEPTIE
jgi:hypothetical protein